MWCHPPTIPLDSARPSAVTTGPVYRPRGGREEMIMNKRHLIVLVAFVAGVVLAGQVRGLPGMNKLPSV